MSNKPTHDELLLFINGNLDSERSDEILVVLAEDDESLEIVEQLWQENGVISANLVTPDDDLDATAVAEVERKLIEHIHRSDLTGDVLRLGTQATGVAYWSLLRPFVSFITGKNAESDPESNQPDK
jgi:hypothetical protein